MNTVLRPEHRDVDWYHQVKVGDAVTFRLGRAGMKLFAQWPGLAVLACARDGSGSTLIPERGASRRAIGKLRCGYVAALLRDLAGQLSVHASAVAFGECAVLFLGESGAGKSTAAAQLCAWHGGRLLADDVALVDVQGEGVCVLPSEEELWLSARSFAALGARSDAAEDGEGKQALRAQIAGRAYPLRLAVVLRFNPSAKSIVMRHLRGSLAARSLLEAAIRFDVEDADARRREFEQVTTVYRHATFVELVRPPRAPGDVSPFVVEALERRA